MSFHSDDEEQQAAKILSDMLAIEMIRAYKHDQPEWARPRRWLYCWEREGLSWLIRFMDQRPGPFGGSAWTAAFIELNRDAILDPGGLMDFNLRAARLEKEAAATQSTGN